MEDHSKHPHHKKLKKHLTTRNILAIVICAAIAVAIPITIVVIQNRQDLRQRAASPSSPPQPDNPSWGSMLTFNNSKFEYVKSVAPINLKTTDGAAITLEGYVKPASPSGNFSPEYTVFSYSPTLSNTQCKASFKLSTVHVNSDGSPRDTYRYRLQISDGTPNGTRTLESSTVYPFDTWTYPVIAIQPGEGQLSGTDFAYLYVNGKLEAPGLLSNSQKFCPQSAPLVFGADQTLSGFTPAYFKGSMDEFRLSNTIRYQPNTPFTPPTSPWVYDRANPTPNVLGLWKFDNDLLDASANYNYLVGSPVTFQTSTVGGNASPSPTGSQKETCETCLSKGFSHICSSDIVPPTGEPESSCSNIQEYGMYSCSPCVAPSLPSTSCPTPPVCPPGTLTVTSSTPGQSSCLSYYCQPNPTPQAVCGNGVCEASENGASPSCRRDCTTACQPPCLSELNCPTVITNWCGSNQVCNQTTGVCTMRTPTPTSGSAFTAACQTCKAQGKGYFCPNRTSRGGCQSLSFTSDCIRCQ